MKAEIANRLYEYRKASGMSQEGVAEAVGVSRQAVSKWECGESSPDTENLIALARLYKVSVDELLFVEPEGMIEPDVAVADEDISDVGAMASQIANFVASETSGSDDPDDAMASGILSAAAEFINSNAMGSVDYSDREGDYADISLENGVHVRDSEKGEEVHVGWDGIHIDNATDHVHIDFKMIARAIRAARKGQQ